MKLRIITVQVMKSKNFQMTLDLFFLLLYLATVLQTVVN